MLPRQDFFVQSRLFGVVTLSSSWPMKHTLHYLSDHFWTVVYVLLGIEALARFKVIIHMRYLLFVSISMMLFAGCDTEEEELLTRSTVQEPDSTTVFQIELQSEWTGEADHDF